MPGIENYHQSLPVNHTPPSAPLAPQAAKTSVGNDGGASQDGRAQAIDELVNDDIVRERTEEFMREKPEVATWLVGTLSKIPAAKQQAVDKLMCGVERFAVGMNPASLDTCVSHLNRCVTKLDAALSTVSGLAEQLSRTDASLKRMRSEPEEIGKWTALTVQSGEDAANLSVAFRQSASLNDDIDPQITNEIGVLDEGKDQVAAFNEIATMYADYYQDLTTALGNTAKDITAGSDGNTLTVDVNDMMDELTKAQASARAMSVKLPDPPPGVSQADWVNGWREQLGDERDKNGAHIGGPVVVEDDGTVKIDTKQIDDMINSLGGLTGTKTDDGKLVISSASYQAWQSGRDAERSNVQSAVQTYVSKFENAQSNFNNLIKLISTTISELADCAKQAMQYGN
jgi:invasin D